VNTPNRATLLNANMLFDHSLTAGLPQIPMTNEQRPSDAELDELSAKLNDGLKTCRSMIENYRAMLRPDANAPANDPEESKEAPGDTIA
jgi:hypothetical protein